MSNMSEEQPARREPEDEISLVDLIAVLIRYRRMIIWGTLLVAVLTALVLYVFPAAGVSEPPEQSYTTERSMLIPGVPPEVSEHLSIDVSGAVQSVLTDTRTLAEVYEELENPVCPKIPEDQSEEEYLTMIRRNVRDEQLSVSWSGGTSTLSLSFTCTDSQTSREFVNNLFGRLGGELQPVLSSQIETAQQSLRETLQSTRRTLAQTVAAARAEDLTGGELTEASIVRYLERQNGASIQTLTDVTLALERLEVIREDPTTLFSTVATPITTLEQGQSRSLIAAVVVIAAFFLFVFVAFVRQYAHNVRNDPEEVGKLRAAWKGQDSARES
jgi:hypothetical protein